MLLGAVVIGVLGLPPTAAADHLGTVLLFHGAADH